MKLRDVMRRNVSTVGIDDRLVSATIKMQQASTGCLVVTRGAEVVGTFTGRDVAGCVAQGHVPSTCLVFRHMGMPAVVAHPAMDILDASRIMVDQKVRYLPVVEGCALVGVVSLSDIASILNETVPSIADGNGGSGTSETGRRAAIGR